MSKRSRFTADFKARVALEALRGDKAIQEIASRHKVHPNQAGTWKKQALEGLGSIFENGSSKVEDRTEEVRDLHAKIGELAVQNDFFQVLQSGARSSSEPERSKGHDRPIELAA